MAYSQSNLIKPSDALNRPLARHAEEVLHGGLAQTAAISRRMGFYIGNIGLLIAEHATSELREIEQICEIPNTANWLLGLINLRGNLVPVFDLHTLMGFAKPADKKVKPMLLILGQGEAAGAIATYELPIHIALVDDDKLLNLPPLPSAIKAFASQAYEKDGQVWFNFDHLGFFESLAARVAA